MKQNKHNDKNEVGEMKKTEKKNKHTHALLAFQM